MEKKKQFFQKRHGIFQRVLSYMLVFAMVLTMGAFSQLGGVVAKADGTTKLTVHFKNTENWDDVYVMLTNSDWSAIDRYGYASSWPGAEVEADTKNDGWYSLTITVPTDGGANLIFNNNGKGEQTTDIMLSLTAGTEEYWVECTSRNGDNKLDADASGAQSNVAPAAWTESISNPPVDPDAVGTTDLTVHFRNTENWDDVYAMLTNSDWSAIDGYAYASSWPGAEVEPDAENDGWYSLTINVPTDGGANLIFNNNGKGEQTTDIMLSLTGKTEEYWVECTSRNGDNKLDAGASGALTTTAPEGWNPSIANPPVGEDEPVVPEDPSTAGAITLKIYYHRADENYDGWSLWLWPYKGSGSGLEDASHQFDGVEDGSAVATVKISSGISVVGYIVRDKDWKKDLGYDLDQYIDITEVISGTVIVKIESGIVGQEIIYGDDVVTGVNVLSAIYNEDGTITVQTTGAIEGNLADAFAVKGADGEVEISKVESGDDNVYTIYLSKKLDTSKEYSLIFNGVEFAVQMPIYYSTQEFEDAYTYTGDDLGATYTSSATTFRVWAPEAEAVAVNLYESGTEGTDDLIKHLEMQKDVNGTWVVTEEGDLDGTYYTYTVTRNGKDTEACDPYARTTGVNGNRAMVIDLDSTDPEGWANDTNPYQGNGINDAIIYEGHIRDLTVDKNSGVSDANKGKYLGLTEAGSVAIQHMKELGITHLHLLPVYDFGSVDETGEGEPYNWGYDPVNYNVPEGSYSTDAYDGAVRVAEFKQMVKSLHDDDISVVMDVVYNHVYDAGKFCMNQIVPGYFSRIKADGSYSSDSGCGNDTASERSMVRKYIVDSVCYWADEYHIDGFRFDLVGLLDTETINEIVTEVHKTHPNVIFYGEGWSMSSYVTKPNVTMATQVNSELTPGFSYFNDAIRDDLKGSVFDKGTGYVSGSTGKEGSIEKDFLGASDWCKSPAQTINYASCHDNNTLFDRLQISRPDASEEDLVSMNNLAAAIYMLAEGVPFMQAGEDFLRSKVKADGSFDENSYSSGDDVNAIPWGNLKDSKYAAVFEYYKGLIAFRKAHGALRLSSAADVAQTISTVDGLDANVVAFDIQGDINGEEANEMFVIFNANPEATEVALPDGEWGVYIDDENAGTEAIKTITSGTATVAPISAMVLVRSTGKVEVAESQVSAGAPDVEFKDAGSVKDAVGLTPEEIEKAKTTDLSIYLTVADAEATATTIEKENIILKAAEKGYTVGQYLDLDLLKKFVGEDAISVGVLKNPIEISVDVPNDLIKDGRVYGIVRIHDGVVELIAEDLTLVDGKITFATDRFSIYAIVYKDSVPKPQDPPKQDPPKQDPPKQDPPKTPNPTPMGDNTPIIPFVVLLVVGLGAIAFVAVRRRRVK